MKKYVILSCGKIDKNEEVHGEYVAGPYTLEECREELKTLESSYKWHNHFRLSEVEYKSYSISSEILLENIRDNIGDNYDNEVCFGTDIEPDDFTNDLEIIMGEKEVKDHFEKFVDLLNSKINSEYFTHSPWEAKRIEDLIDAN